jgi:2-keto-3-deoxy-L-rhamnonate aldolase RhmA
MSSFRQKFAAGELLAGTFIKTPTTHATEIIGSLGYDFVVIDEEHAPFDRLAIDAALLAAAHHGIAGIVRVASAEASHILSVLDCGATGVLVPHVASAAKAREVAAAARYSLRRGYSGSVRAAGYGSTPMWSYIEAADAATTVIAQIEDVEALDEIDAIAAVDGIDGLFIGRGDLTAAMHAPSNDAPEIRTAVERIAKAARRAGKPIAVFVGNLSEAKWLRDFGASFFVVSSDQGFMRRAAASALSEVRSLDTGRVATSAG